MPAQQNIQQENRRKLIRLLQMAYSGEKSAALAYQGHAASVHDPLEKAMILQIEQDEWHHRALVGEILTELGAAPSPTREVLQVMIGRTLKLLSPFSGWFLPMYCAWKLELNNIQEYAKAIEYAQGMGREDFIPGLTRMSNVEKDHADYFQGVVQSAKPPVGAFQSMLVGIDLMMAFLFKLSGV